MVSRIIEFDTPDGVRVYNFPDGEKVLIENIIRIRVDEAGIHYVEYLDFYTNELCKTIVNLGWLSVDVDRWGEPALESECECGCGCGLECDDWTDDDKMEIGRIAIDIIHIADRILDNSRLRAFLEYMEE